MREPACRERSDRELRRALRWALRKLQLGNWTWELVFDAKAVNHPLLREMGGVMGRVRIYLAKRHFVAGILRQACAGDDVDPVYTVMHESVHVMLDCVSSLADPDDKLHELFEQVVESVALVLHELWRAEREDE